MPPTHLAPSAPALTGRFLTFREREEIAIDLARGTGIRAIARKLARSPSTISREVRRNAATRGGNLDYRASTAQWHADRAAARPRPGKLASNPALRAYVEERLSGQVTDAHAAIQAKAWTANMVDLSKFPRGVPGRDLRDNIAPYAVWADPRFVSSHPHWAYEPGKVLLGSISGKAIGSVMTAT